MIGATEWFHIGGDLIRHTAVNLRSKNGANCLVNQDAVEVSEPGFPPKLKFGHRLIAIWFDHVSKRLNLLFGLVRHGSVQGLIASP